ncbi:MAG: hypothetical protein H8E66_30745 [Planctomycetes bacterium]|nr:hypothetical protein [Planctomycetota bacterium]
MKHFIPVLLCILFTQDLRASEPLPSFEHRELWEPLSGTWVFEDNDTVRQTATADDRNTAFLLKWKGELPKAYHLSVQIERDTSLKDTEGKPLDNGFVVANASADGLRGHGFGFDRRVGRLRQFRWMVFDEAERRRTFSRSTTANWAPWHYFAVAVDGPYYEMYYDHRNWPKYRPAEEMAVPREVMFAGHSWLFTNQRGLVLRVEGVPGAFRALKVMHLEDAPLPERFSEVQPSGDARQLKAEGADLRDANRIFTQTRPTFEWNMRGEAMRWHDMDFVNTIYDSKGRAVERGTVHGLDRSWRPRKSLEPGDYEWELQAGYVQGPLRGGQLREPFTIEPKARVDPDAIEVITPRAIHFAEVRPTLAWRWKWSGTPTHVEVYRGDERLNGEGALADGSFTWTPAKSLEDGLNRLTLRFYEGDTRLASYESLAVRTKVIDRFTIRSDGVLLKNGEFFVALATFRDPGDRGDYVPKTVTRLLEGNYTINHAYRFEGGHYWRIQNRPDKEDLIKEALSEAYFQKQVDDARTFLRLCDENGVKAFLGLQRWWVTRGEWDHIERFVAALMGEPGLLAWYTYDEPNWVGLSPALMSETARRIRAIDPYHPVKLYLNNRWEITDYIRGMDIVATHMGPQLPLVINEWTQMAPHATSLTGRPHPPAIWGGDRFGKTTPELVWSAKYVQLIGGARGWTDYYRPFIHANYPETWSAICEANGMLKQVMPLFLRDGEELAVPSSQPTAIDTKAFTDTDSARIKMDDAGSAFMARARKGQDGDVVLAVFNYGSRKGTWSWDVSKDLLTAHVETLAGAGICNMRDGQVRVTLEPFTGTAIQLRVE